MSFLMHIALSFYKFSPAIIEDSSFVIDLTEKPHISQEQSAGSQSMHSNASVADTLQNEQRVEGLTNEDGQKISM